MRTLETPITTKRREKRNKQANNKCGGGTTETKAPSCALMLVVGREWSKESVGEKQKGAQQPYGHETMNKDYSTNDIPR